MCRKLSYLVLYVLALSVTFTGTTKAELVGWWRFDESSGTTAYDTSGNGNDGTFNGEPQWVSGFTGGALEFDGVDDYVAIGDLDLTGSFTLTFWMQPSSIPGDWHSVVMKEYDYGFEFDGNSLLGRVGDGAGGWGATVSTTISTPAVWYHTAITWNGSDLEMFIDASSVGQNTGTHVSNDNSLLFGSWNTSGEFFNGIIDDVRIYDHVLSEVEILSAMEGQIWPYAFGPDPADGTLYPDTWVNLSWSPGGLAVSHDVYFGDNFDDVNAGAESTFVGNQTATFLVVGFPGFPYPDGLVPGTTYYWRIDEVNDTEPNSPWKGDLWSFGIPPKTAYSPEPADGAASVVLDVELSWTVGFGAKLHYVYFGDNFDDVNNAAGGLPHGSTTFDPGPLKLAKTYYWRVDEFDVVETHKGEVWSFTTEGGVANSDPAKGAVDITQTPILTWSPGVFADTHEVYFGADAASLELKGSGNLGSESYEPGQLEWNTTYYWRIDEANNANTDSPWTGPLWSFTTANFLTVDDFESYNDLDPADPASNRIFFAWVDGFDNPAVNGSVVGYANPPFAEQSIVHGGNQSMPFAYDNAVGKSEATLTSTSSRDWTVKGVNTLTIWFRGEAANAAETLYVALNDSAVVANDKPDAAQAGSWTQWNIDLQAFADQGVNLANVNTITLGLGNRSNPVAGGAGIMYFDDIRLYAP
ncbi:MAG: LamG domain-containing protein [Planctomycetes bacterium]|nr:LamG domain-containing protein [Planctomycetota bacterium]